MITPDTVLLLWFAGLGLLTLLTGGLVLDVRRVTRYSGRHVRIPGQHRATRNDLRWAS